VTAEVLTRIEGKAGRISLNRPAALHALNIGMVHAMTAQLLAWKKSRKVACVMIDHSEGRGFCAGGDIRFLQDSALKDGVEGRKFFHDEYQLNHLLFEYQKPVIAFMDGITMGGGVGVSQPAKFRVATENTRFAMPETGIGLFPDVGGGWYLSRLEGRVGRFLALIAALEADGSEWAIKERATLSTKSPQTCKVALRQLAEGAEMASFADNMAMEYRIGSRVLVRHDFIEGVRAVIVDKDNAPKWDPATPEGVTDALLDGIFAPLPANEEWTPL